MLYKNQWAAIYNPYADSALGQQPYDWFRLDENGFLLTGWFTDIDGNLYYLNPNSDNTKGCMLVVWNTIDAKEYYFNSKSDGTRGRLFRNEQTPDQHYVGGNSVIFVLMDRGFSPIFIEKYSLQ